MRAGRPSRRQPVYVGACYSAGSAERVVLDSQSRGAAAWIARIELDHACDTVSPTYEHKRITRRPLFADRHQHAELPTIVVLNQVGMC